MKNQINILNQLQEVILTRDEHHQTGDGSHMDSLNNAIDHLTSKLDPQPRGLYQRLYKKDHIFMSPMVKNSCAICSMKLPIAQVQQVKLGERLQTCPTCGRILFDESDDAPHYIGERLSRAEEIRKSGISRFSAESLVIPALKGTTPQDAIAELSAVMAENNFISNPDQLVAAAMDRENMFSTALGHGAAFPHVRGVEGGGLTLAMGVSKKGIVWDDSGEKVHLVFFSTIPTAVSAFYLRLVAGLSAAFRSSENLDAALGAGSSEELWKVLIKATRKTVK